MNRESSARAADSHEVIEVRGARENNLANVSLDIPKRKLTVSLASRAPARARSCSRR